MRLVTYLIEYLGKFEFIFETVLDYESRDQMGSFEAKKRSRKSHAWEPLRSYCCFLENPTVIYLHKTLVEVDPVTISSYL
jgi:hypothetical protein